MKQPLIVKANTPIPAFHYTLADVEPEIGDSTDEVITCALCPRRIWFRDSYSPGDDAICAECDTEVTGRVHPPSLPVPWGDVIKGAIDFAAPGTESATITHERGECGLTGPFVPECTDPYVRWIPRTDTEEWADKADPTLWYRVKGWWTRFADWIAGI